MTAGNHEDKLIELDTAPRDTQWNHGISCFELLVSRPYIHIHTGLHRDCMHVVELSRGSELGAVARRA